MYKSQKALRNWENFNIAGSGAFLYLAASPAKRFRPCKLRVCSVSTGNQKTTKKISLKVSSNLRESRAVSSTVIAEERATELDIPDIDNYEPVEQDEPLSNTRYQTRREREFESWKEIRESLLTSRIEEEEFLTGINCCSCGIANAEFGCLECGQDQYLCQSCANSTHETINYFHVLEKFKVRKIDLILSTSVFIFYVATIAGSILKHHVIYNLGRV